MRNPNFVMKIGFYFFRNKHLFLHENSGKIILENIHSKPCIQSRAFKIIELIDETSNGVFINNFM